METGTLEDGGLNLAGRSLLGPDASARARVRDLAPEAARTGMKRGHPWDGYKLHLTETCDAHTPHLITHVVTTDPTVTDFEMTGPIHTALAHRDLLPDEHLVDTGYVTARELVAATDRHGVELVGPVMPDTTWQASAAAGYATTDFHIDWDTKKVICPQGERSSRWSAENNEHGHPVVKVRFSAGDCRPCPVRELCTRAASHGRTLQLLPRAEHERLVRARREQQTQQWQEKYRPRAGVEGTIGEAVGVLGARRARYRGHDKTALQHQLIAAALNLTRIDAWQIGTPLAKTRTSRFAVLRPAA